MLFQEMKKILIDAFRLSAERVIEQMATQHPELLRREVSQPANDYR